MKKICSLAALALLFATPSFSQNGSAKKTNWGIKLGLNTSNLRVENAANSKWKGGLVTGVYVNVNVNDRFSIQPEALYSSMGGRELGSAQGTSLRLNYFSVPVLAKYQLAKNVSVLAGPQIDVMIQAKAKGTSGFSKVTDQYKENSFNLTGGAAYQPLKCLGFSLRYIYGLNNVAATGSQKIKNQGLQLNTALKL